ncbi:MAG: hypothetical protein WCD34_13840, partial [Candidatus Acidiferrum sp.]
SQGSSNFTNSALLTTKSSFQFSSHDMLAVGSNIPPRNRWTGSSTRRMSHQSRLRVTGSQLSSDKNGRIGESGLIKGLTPRLI